MRTCYTDKKKTNKGTKQQVKSTKRLPEKRAVKRVLKVF